VAIDAAAIVALMVVPLPPRPHPTFSSHRPRFVATLTAGLMIGSIALAAFALNPPKWLVQVSPGRLDFGTVAQSSRVQKPITLVNRTTSPFSIKTINSTCPCASIQLDDPRLLPGQPIRAVFELDLAREPFFVGKLGIEVEGQTENGDIAFRMLVKVKVAARAQ
jgi:hypothetical protein